MVRKGLGLAALLVAVALVAPSALAWTQNGQSLGSVRLPRAVMANGESVAAGTYTVRTSPAAVTDVVGQATDGTMWVEFVQADQVRGRELATVLTGDAVREVAKGAAPASGSSKVEMLKGNEYLRVWINRGGTHYLIHLSAASID